MRAVAAFALLASLVACSAAEEKADPQSRSQRPALGEEPLETASITDDEVVPLTPERAATARPPSGRPCAWARAWQDPSSPKPHLAGVGGVPNPEKRSETAIRLPDRDPIPQGEIVVEAVVGPDGAVREASVVGSTTPPWPEAEASILDAIRRWTYEPPRFDGTPVSVCVTILVSP
ncbi:MAG TPA: TonB family protein [Vicinamibacteria bacterium]|nr:TonB family protein [Vicinamibacteria bacterium]